MMTAKVAGPHSKKKRQAANPSKGGPVKRLLMVVLGLSLAATLIATPSLARSSSSTPATLSNSTPCTRLAAQVLFHGFVIANDLIARGIAPSAVVETLERCQYRIFVDEGHPQDHYTFTEDDWIVGGIVVFDDYVAQGIPRADSIAFLESIGGGVWLAKVRPDGSLGPAVEQPLMRTRYLDWNYSGLGVIVYQHRAFIKKLPPGDYVSTHVQTWPGEPNTIHTIYLHVEPTP